MHWLYELSLHSDYYKLRAQIWYSTSTEALLNLNPVSAETKIFQDDSVGTLAANILAPSIPAIWEKQWCITINMRNI